MSKAKSRSEIASVVILIVLAVILLPILAINLTLIIKGSIDPDTPPSVFGIAPLAVTSGSMEGDEEGSFPKGSLIFVRILDDDARASLEENDVITFRTSDSFVTHRIVGVLRGDDGETLSYVTRGDANNVNDGAIPKDSVVGVCVAAIPGLGDFAMFLQTPAGILVFVGIPVLLFIAYDVTRIVLHNKRVQAENEAGTAEKDEEIRRLRAMLEEKERTAPTQSDAPSDGTDDNLTSSDK